MATLGVAREAMQFDFTASSLSYNSCVALETLDGWFLTVDQNGTVTISKPVADWYTRGSMPFEAARLDASATFCSSPQRPTTGGSTERLGALMHGVRPAVCTGTAREGSIGGSERRLPGPGAPILWVFKVVDLRDPLAAGPVHAGDPVWLQVLSDASGDNTGNGGGPSHVLPAGAPADWRQEGGVLSSYACEVAPLDSQAVDMEGRTFGDGDRGEPRYLAQHRTLSYDGSSLATGEGRAARTTPEFGFPQSGLPRVQLQPDSQASGAVALPRMHGVQHRERQSSICREPEEPVGGVAAPSAAPSQSASRRTHAAPLARTARLDFVHVSDFQGPPPAGRVPHSSGTRDTDDDDMALLLSQLETGDWNGSRPPQDHITKSWGSVRLAPAYVPQASTELLRGPVTAENVSGKYSRHDREYAGLYARLNAHALIAGKWLLQSARNAPSEHATYRKKDLCAWSEGADDNSGTAASGGVLRVRRKSLAASVTSSPLGISNFDEVFLQQDWVCLSCQPAVEDYRCSTSPMAPPGVGAKESDHALRLPATEKCDRRTDAPGRAATAPTPRPMFLQAFAQGASGGALGSQFRVAEGAVFRVRLLQTGGEGAGPGHARSGAARLGDRVALLASSQLRASEKRRLGVAVARRPAELRRHGRAANTEQSPVPGDPTAAANIVALARAARATSERRCARIYTEHERGIVPRERSSRVLGSAVTFTAPPLRQVPWGKNHHASSCSLHSQSIPPVREQAQGAACLQCLCAHSGSTSAVDLCAENAAVVAELAGGGARADEEPHTVKSETEAVAVWRPENAASMLPPPSWRNNFERQDGVMAQVVAHEAKCQRVGSLPSEPADLLGPHD